MKKLGAYISPRADTWASPLYFTKGCFVYYEYITGVEYSRINIWRLDALLDQAPDEVIYLRSPDHLKAHIEPMIHLANHHVSYHDRLYRIRNMVYRYYIRDLDIEIIDELSVDAVDHYETWRHDHTSAIQFLKEAKLTDLIHYRAAPKIDYTRKRPIASFNDLVIPETVDDMIKKQLKESLEKSALNSYYGTGGFTTNPDPFKVVKISEKETETMEKKMTETDIFLKHINGITITSTYSKLDYGCGEPYYIYYPEMEITEDIADTLFTVLLMAKGEYIHKVVFNPEKGTTTIYCNWGSATVRCKDCEFDYILGYEMARLKAYLGKDDYNWFNKIKNHRKTHIQYTEKPTEPKAKRASKKGGKK